MRNRNIFCSRAGRVVIGKSTYQITVSQILAAQIDRYATKMEARATKRNTKEMRHAT